jgi:SH3 domain-containing YSC84-like protein 1
MRTLAVILGMSLCSIPAVAENANERLQDATEVFREIMSVPEKSIPQDLLKRAHCVMIIPGVKEAAFGVGGKYGRGFAMCRKPGGEGWGAPTAVRLEGGSFGFQIGGSSTDVVMLVMNERGMKKLLESKFTLGGDATATAGPVGRSVSAQTDAYLNAEILTWSRSRGLFAGISLEGATLRNDLDENEELYGRRLHNREILMTNMKPPASASDLIAMLNRYSLQEGEGVVKAKEPQTNKR